MIRNVRFFIYILCSCMLIHQSARCENPNQKWAGKWQLNAQDAVLGGVMEIFNCDDVSCNFKLQSWYNLHICDAEGKIEITGNNAEYKGKKYQYDRDTDTEYFISVGILFQMDSFSAFCGMQATLEGNWIRQ